MHGGINMRGGRWSNMEDEIARLLGDGKAMMRVTVTCASPLDLRPERFAVELFPLGQRRLWNILNFSPFFSDPRSPEHWRVRIFEEIKRRVAKRAQHNPLQPVGYIAPSQGLSAGAWIAIGGGILAVIAVVLLLVFGLGG